jgi:hypothetical protein
VERVVVEKSNFDEGAVDSASESVLVGGASPAPGGGDFDEAGERKGLIEMYGKALESFDRAVLAVAGGGLAISVTFLHDVAPHPVGRSLLWLWIGWIGLALSLSSIIASMLTGHRALEDALRGGKITKFTGYTTALNIAAGLTVVVGLLSLAGFAQINMFDAERTVTTPQAAAPSPCASSR